MSDCEHRGTLVPTAVDRRQRTRMPRQHHDDARAWEAAVRSPGGYRTPFEQYPGDARHADRTRGCQHPFEVLGQVMPTDVGNVMCHLCGVVLRSSDVLASAARELEQARDCAGGLAG